jgi:hypothetical protein
MIGLVRNVYRLQPMSKDLETSLGTGVKSLSGSQYQYSSQRTLLLALYSFDFPMFKHTFPVIGKDIIKSSMNIHDQRPKIGKDENIFVTVAKAHGG